MASAKDANGFPYRVQILSTSGTARASLQCASISAGAADAGKILLLNAAGKIDSTVVSSWHAGDTGANSTWLAGSTS